MDKFNLSKRRFEINGNHKFLGEAYLEQDVKEFIKLLKARLPELRNDHFIDQLAGDKLK